MLPKGPSVKDDNRVEALLLAVEQGIAYQFFAAV